MSSCSETPPISRWSPAEDGPSDGRLPTAVPLVEFVHDQERPRPDLPCISFACCFETVASMSPEASSLVSTDDD